MKLKDKFKCWLKGCIVIEDQWEWNWSDGEEWACNTCPRCGAELTKGNYTKNIRVHKKYK